MRLAFAIVAGVVLAAAVVTASKSIPGYCGQQWPKLFAASLCGHVTHAGGDAVGRQLGTFVRGTNRAMQTGGLASPTWTKLGLEEPGSWQHTDGHDYVVIESVQFELACNGWSTFQDWPVSRCLNSTCTRDTTTLGPGGQAMRATFNTGAGQIYVRPDAPGMVGGDWVTQCVYAWVESGTLPIRVSVKLGTTPNITANNDVTLTTIPTEHCVRLQHDGIVGDTMFARLFEDPAGDGTGVPFLVGYISILNSSIATTPIDHSAAVTPCNTGTQREADVLPFSTKDLSVESGEGQVDVAWLYYPYNWPATPTVKTIVDLLEAADWRVIYDRPDASTNEIQFDAGGASVAITTTFARGDVARLTIRWRSGEPLQLCVDGVCATSAGNYTPPAGFDTNGCWGCHDPDGTPGKFLDGGLREARLR
ncbi:hypothetical protein LCGC14_0460060 [marine sediment metagenome]|uniref:Uncharacterized protein n=1 Tax=marine sediment metagenome TaxID=412755 RepID=A0A0F9V212_9ZZZZ